MIQSKNEYPNYYFRNIKSKNKLTPITTFKTHSKVLKRAQRSNQIQRKDGVELSGTFICQQVMTKRKEKLPLLIWAYPAEYKDKNSAGQNDKTLTNLHFPSYGSFIYWVTKGYAPF